MAAVAALLLMILAAFSATPASAATGTYVRLAQLTDDMTGTELVITSIANPRLSITVPAVGYGELSPYHRVEPGDYVIGLRPAGSTELPAVSKTLNAMAGSAYTLAAIGPATARSLTIFTDDLTPPAAGQAAVRVINAASSAPRLDVRGPAGVAFALNLASGEVGAYRSVPAGTITLAVGPPGATGNPIPVTVGANQIASVVLITRAGAVTAQTHLDGDGPAVLPPGPVDAGFGGAADRPGGATPQLAFLLLAVAAAGLSAHLARRSRSARHESC